MPLPSSALLRARQQFLTIFLVATVLGGCAVTLISRYDETTDKDVSALQKTVNGLLTQLERAKELPSHESTQSTYDGIATDLAAIQLRNDARSRNQLTIDQLALLKKNLDAFEDLHKQGLLNKAMIKPQRSILDQTFRAILTLELKKKELDE